MPSFSFPPRAHVHARVRAHTHTTHTLHYTTLTHLATETSSITKWNFFYPTFMIAKFWGDKTLLSLSPPDCSPFRYILILMPKFPEILCVMSLSLLEEASQLATPQTFGLSPPTLPTLKMATVTIAETSRYFHSSMQPNPKSQSIVVNVVCSCIYCFSLCHK